MKNYINLVLIFLLLLLSVKTTAQTRPIIIEENIESKFISENFYIYDEAPNREESLQGILQKSSSFKLTNTKVAAYFASEAGHWLKFKIVSQSEKDLILDTGLLSYDELDCYFIGESGKISQFPRVSWKTLKNIRTINSDFYAFPIKLLPEKPMTILVRGKNTKGTFRMPLRISTKERFNKIEKQNEHFFGILFGTSFFIISLGISFYFLTKDKSYLYYVLSVVSLIIQSSLINSYFCDTIGRSFLPAADPTYGNLFIPFFAYFHILFLKSILLDKTRSPKFVHNFSRYLGFWAIALAIVMLFCLVDNRLFKYMAYMVYVMYSGMIINLTLNLIQGFKYNRINATFILVSNTPFFLYLLYMILTNLRLVKQNSPYNIVMWCLLFDNLILCIGLAFRFNFVSKKEIKLQKEINLQLSKTFEAERNHQQEQIKRLEAQYNLQIEKQRISRDLHDNIGSQLTYITSNIDFYSSKLRDSPEIQHKLTNLSEYVRTTTQQLRDTIWTINKENISINDFTIRVKNYIINQIEHAENLVTNFDFTIAENSPQLNSVQALNLFRVVQEAINNMLKYSEATLLVVRIDCSETQITFEIKENGKGFLVEEKKNTGNGLLNMQTRVTDLNGDFKISSSPQSGTTLKITIPFEINTP
ncbi:MAG: histidine kinase [Emticicia sp.]|nr:histidine kinase [Emticicia sp.]